MACTLVNSIAGFLFTVLVQALLDLYNKLNGPHWTPVPWDPFGGASSDPCDPEWDGLVCTTTPAGEKHIFTMYALNRRKLLTTRRQLAAKGLVGSIPASIGAFSYLQVNSFTTQNTSEFTFSSY